MLLESQDTMYWGDRTSVFLPLEAMQNLSVRVSLPAKAQQEPQCYWSLMSWTQEGHWVLESKFSGRVTNLKKFLKDLLGTLVRGD